MRSKNVDLAFAEKKTDSLLFRPYLCMITCCISKRANISLVLSALGRSSPLHRPFSLLAKNFNVSPTYRYWGKGDKFSHTVNVVKL
jgi:hypothetical protein